MKDQISSSYAKIVNIPEIVKPLILISLFASLVISIAFWIGNGVQVTSISLLALTVISILLLFIQNLGYNKVAALVLYLVVSFVLTFNISIGHGIHDEAMIAYPLLIVFSGLVFGKRAGVIVTGITVFQMILVHILAQAGHVQPFGGAVQMKLDETITTIIILIATGFLVWIVVDIIENAVEKIIQAEVDLESAYEDTLAAWAKALELREREAPGHSTRVTSLATLLAEKMGLDSNVIKQIRQGALLHDIGKMGIPESILLKSEPLKPKEKKLLKEHTIMASGIISDIDYLEGALEVISHHHERYDGNGYPQKLKGDQFSLKAQIFSIIDNWDMLRVDRPCRKAWSDEKTLAYISDQSGKKFNPDIVEVFLKMMDEIGSGGID
jgi:putative nucleotidyltransferase with HDIG domain